MKFLIQTSVFFASLFALNSCRIEKAKPFKKQHITIVSDCLKHEDEELFKSLKKYKSIDIYIIHLPFDSIKARLKKEGLNTEIDAVILSSVYYMNQLDQLHLLQKLPIEDFPENLNTKHISATRTWSGIGIDPYLISTKDDTLFKIKNYNDLLENQWCSTLKDEDKRMPFYTFIVHKMDPGHKYNHKDWIRDFNSKKIEILNDSLSGACKITFYKYSEGKRLHENRNARIIFPNQRKGGYYYDMPCFGIIRQARNYYNAKIFLHYLFTESANKGLNFKLNTYPLIYTKGSDFQYQNIRHKRSILSPVQLITNYQELENL